MENNSLICPTEKFPVKVERLKRYPHFSSWNARNGFSFSITTFLVFHTSSRSTERNLSRSFWEKVASISVHQCTICLYSADSMKSLSNHECLSLGIGKYLVFQKIYSNAHLHFGCPQQSVHSADTLFVDFSRSPSQGIGALPKRFP